MRIQIQEQQESFNGKVLIVDFPRKDTYLLKGNLKESDLVGFSKLKEFGANKPIKSLMVMQHKAIFEPIQRNLKVVYKI